MTTIEQTDALDGWRPFHRTRFPKDNPERFRHRITGEGPCKEAELEALLKEAVGRLAANRHAVRSCGCPDCRFLERDDVKRFL